MAVAEHDPGAMPALHASGRAAAAAEAARIGRRALALGTVRLLLVAGLLLALAALIAAPTPLRLALAVAPLAGFLLLGGIHAALDRRRAAAEARAEWHRRGEERCAGTWRHGQDDGTTHASADHPYARDLDVVGPGGLFQLLESGASAAGRARLARWLLDDGHPGDPARAASVRALVPHHGWRADLAAAARDAGSGGADALDAWLAAPPAGPSVALRVAFWALRLGVLAAVVAVGWRVGAAGAFWTYVGGVVVLAQVERVARARLAALGDPDDLRRALLGEAERLAVLASLPTGATPALAGIAGRASTAEAAAAGLARLLDRLAQQRNPLWAHGVAPLLLAQWGTLRRLRAWALANPGARTAWRDALAEAEATACLATYVAEQGGCWPEAAGDGPAFTAEALAHALLPTSRRVANDVAIAAGGVLLITGANASGKSTLLRAAGLAWVLARAGATVPARTCRLRPARLAAVMRVGDDLGAGLSRFQAEVAALARAWRRLDGSGDGLVLLLDEILAGTNSHERHLGTRAMLEAVRGRALAVLVTTHDLALCALADGDGAIALGHFADAAAAGGDDLAFDYRLRAGSARSTNALKVMKAAGLPV